MLTALLVLTLAEAAPKKLVFSDAACHEDVKARNRLAWQMAETGWLRTCEELYGDGEPRHDRLYVILDRDGAPARAYVNDDAGPVAQCVAHVLSTSDYPAVPDAECGYEGEAALDIVTPGASHLDWYRTVPPDVNHPEGEDEDWRVLPPAEQIRWVAPDPALLANPHPGGPHRARLKPLADALASGTPVAEVSPQRAVRPARTARGRAAQLCDARIEGHDFFEGTRLWTTLLPDPNAAVEAALCARQPWLEGGFDDNDVGRALLDADPRPLQARRAMLAIAVSDADTGPALMLRALAATPDGDPLADIVMDRAVRVLDQYGPHAVDEWLRGASAQARWRLARRVFEWGMRAEAFTISRSVESESTGTRAAQACYVASSTAPDEPGREAAWKRLEAYAADPSDPERAAEAQRLLSR